MKRSIIKSTGRFVPRHRVTNDDLTRMLDTSDEWIRQRTGIEARHWVGEGEDLGTSDLALEASRIALRRAGWDPSDLDLIVFATMTADVYIPGAGVFLQHKLGAKAVPALDIRQQCTGFLHGLELCDAYVKSGKAGRILLVGAETQSRFLELNTRNRDTAVIFADGAGAVCIEAVESTGEIGILDSVFHADGRYAGVLKAGVPDRKSGPVMSAEVLARREYLPHMEGKAVFKLAVTRLPRLAAELLAKAGLGLPDVDMVVPHQANLRINEAFRASLNLDERKIYNNIQRYGNTTGASIPIALDELMEERMLNAGDIVMFIGLGAGLTWGGVLYRLP